jgi:hypothetical protein
MDHVPVPQGYSKDSWYVPLVATFDYDFYDFGSFPQRHGFMMEDGGLNMSRSSVDLASMLQSWLYFGLLSEFLDRQVTTQHLESRTSTPNLTPRDFFDFYDPGRRDPSPTSDPSTAGDHPRLRSFGLPNLLDEWQTELRRQDAATVYGRLPQLKKVIETALKGSLMFDRCQLLGSDEHATVALSVKLLLSTLIHAYNSLYPDDRFLWLLDDLIPLQSLDPRPGSPSALLLLRRMIDSGWCPQAAQRACSSRTYHTVYYMSHLPRMQQGQHSRCDKRQCTAYNIDEKQYRTVHTSDTCQCEHVGIDTGKLAAMIKGGDIPVVQFEKMSSGRIHLSLAQHRVPQHYGMTAPRSYNCISHVWADGLGNPESNSLPQCQLQRLYDLASGTAESETISGIFLWIDTLCIPVGEVYRDQRRKAIDSMASLYQDALGIIVISKEVREQCAGLPHDSSGSTQIMAYILCCAWNARCWCFQEAVLSRRFLFDTPIGLFKLPVNMYGMSPFEPRYRSAFTGFQGPLLPRLLSEATAIFGKEAKKNVNCIFDADRITRDDAVNRWILWHVVSRPVHWMLVGLRTVIFDRFPIFRTWRIMTSTLCGLPFFLKSLPSASGLRHKPAASFLRLSVGIASYLVIMAIGAAASLGAVMFALGCWLKDLTLNANIWLDLHGMYGTDQMKSEKMLEHQMQHQIAAELVADLQPLRVSQHSATRLSSVKKQHRWSCALPTRQARTARLDDSYVRAAFKRATQFAQVWNALACRSTTKMEDFHSILATLANITAYRVMEFSSPAERMRAIINSYEALPLSLIFQSTATGSLGRDPMNLWLPIVLTGELMRFDRIMIINEDSVSFRVQLTLAWREQANRRSEDRRTFARLSNGIFALEVEHESALPDASPSQDVCYVVELSLSQHLSEQPCTVRGAKLLVQSERGHDLNCSYHSPVQVKVSRPEPRYNGTPVATVELLRPDTRIALKFNHEVGSKHEYLRPLDISGTASCVRSLLSFLATIVILLIPYIISSSGREPLNNMEEISTMFAAYSICSSPMVEPGTILRSLCAFILFSSVDATSTRLVAWIAYPACVAIAFNISGSTASLRVFCAVMLLTILDYGFIPPVLILTGLAAASSLTRTSPYPQIAASGFASVLMEIFASILVEDIDDNNLRSISNVLWCVLLLGSNVLPLPPPVRTIGTILLMIAFDITASKPLPSLPLVITIMVYLYLDYTMTWHIEKVSQAEYDKRLASYGKTGIARFTVTWLRTLSHYTAPWEGEPQRWFHNLNDTGLFRKFTS